MMLILQKEMLISTVSRKRNACNPKAREKSFEAVESAERAGVSPDFAVLVSFTFAWCIWGTEGKECRLGSEGQGQGTYLRAQGSLLA